MSAKQKMLSALKNNRSFTTRQARQRFRVWNVAARIHDLRKEGHNIITGVKKLTNGKTAAFYSLG